jgi:hypothetical protein
MRKMSAKDWIEKYEAMYLPKPKAAKKGLK